MTLSLAKLAKELGLSKNAVTKAVQEGRITSYIKTRNGYEFDAERAIQEYLENTNGNLSSNPKFGSFGGDDEIDPEDAARAKMSPLDLEPKFWNERQAKQAKEIYQALTYKLELEVEQGKYYAKAEADKFWSTITNSYARSLLSVAGRLKQKHSDLPEAVFEDLKNICDEISKDVKKTFK